MSLPNPCPFPTPPPTPGVEANAEVGTHPTGMLSCLLNICRILLLQANFFQKKKENLVFALNFVGCSPIAHDHSLSQTIMHRLGNFATVRKLVESGSDLGQVDLEKKGVLHLLPDKTRDAQHTKFLLQKG